MSARTEWLRTGGRKWLLLLADAAVCAASLYAAYLLRFEGDIPAYYHEQFRTFLPLVVAIRVVTNGLFGLQHWSFRLAGLPEGSRIVLAHMAGTTVFVAVPYALGIIMPPRSVVVIEFFLSTSLAAAVRFSIRLTRPWLLEQRRAHGPERVVRAVIVGAGSAGDLLLRDLVRSGGHAYDIVGFVDDDSRKWRTTIGGRPVLGAIDALPAIARRKEIDELLIAIPGLPPERIRGIVASLSDLKLRYRILPISFSYLRESLGSARLADLAPEDLLHRQAADFDPAELRRLVEGRRILVTGAAGSIGSEICRQLAGLGAAELALADIDENNLYFLSRELERSHPRLRLASEVVDIRDRARLLQLAHDFRPQDVFHAAAHKHVPLLETAPEEAIKNNVTGCRNVIEMAEEAGVERFVLISTDKAVRPVSVMGASKRLAEMLVRAQAERSRTRFTVVRFGNVLGTAGSVVPLFKRQIAAGGPVTVTHAGCRRYLMTIDEAVGLVILAGLGGFGELCILEMGEPLRILDLARLMITLVGSVPEQDVPIEITGLRPGEKLDEEPMAPDEAARSRAVAPKIRVIEGSPPPPDLYQHVARLEALAAAGNRDGLREALRRAVPDYEPWAAAQTLPAAAARP